MADPNIPPVLVLDQDDDVIYLAVYDKYAGRRNRYTVYRVLLRASKRADIVGREVDLDLANQIARYRR
jgi:hypothetical protein